MNELKFFDTSINDAVISGTMTINNLTIVPEGTGESERIGRKFHIHRISILYGLQLPAATDASKTTDTVRCMLVQDRQTNGAQFVATDLIDSDVLNSFNNLANKNRFKVLYKQEYTLKAGGAAPSGASFIFSEDRAYLRFTLNVSIQIEYDNSLTTGVIATVKSNNIYWVTQSNTGICEGIGLARIRFTDY